MDILKKITSLVILVLIVTVFFSLAWVSHWSDSELWALGLARDFFKSHQPSTDYKILFNAVLNLSYHFPFDNRWTVQAARTIFAILGLGVVGLLSLFVYLLQKNKKAALWTGFLLLSSSLFLSQGFKLRSDMLACFFQILALCHYLWFRKKQKQSPFDYFLNILLCVTVLLATPKGIFHLAVNISFIYSMERLSGQGRFSKDTLLRIVPVVIGLFGIFLAWKWEQFQTAAVFFLQSFSASEHHPSFFSMEAFRYVGEALTQQWLMVLLLIQIFIVKSKRPLSPQLQSLGWASLAALTLILLHNDRLPFFILSLLPLPIAFIGVASAEYFQHFCERLPRPGRIGRDLIVIAATVQAFSTVYNVYWAQNNQTQIQLQEQMQVYLRSYPETVYYDSTVVLPRDNSIFVFPAPMHFGNRQEVLGVLKRPDLGLVFFGNRLFYYLNDFYLELEEKFFIRIGKGVFAKAHVIRAQHKLSGEEWRNLCKELSADQVYVYEGSSFLEMKFMGRSKLQPCNGDVPQIQSKEDFISFSIYDPFETQNEKSFAEIFDAGL